jgi:hypothetical protein
VKRITLYVNPDSGKCWQPAYLPLLPLLYLPPVARRIDREARGCADGSCVVSAPPTHAEVRS